MLRVSEPIPTESGKGTAKIKLERRTLLGM